MSTVWTVVAVAGAATFLLKAVGPVLLGGRELPARVTGVLSLLAPALLAALVATQFLGGDRELVLDERLVGLARRGRSAGAPGADPRRRCRPRLLRRRSRAAFSSGRRVRRLSLAHDPVDLEDLGEVPVHVQAVGPGEIPYVLGIRVVPVLLRCIALERPHLPLQVLGLE